MKKFSITVITAMLACFGSVSNPSTDTTAILLTAVLSAAYFGSGKLMKKGLSPIALIGISAIMGILVYGR